MHWYLVSYVLVYTIERREYRQRQHLLTPTGEPSKILLEIADTLHASTWYKTKYLREYEETGKVHIGPPAHPRLITKIEIRPIPQNHVQILQDYLWF